MSHLVDLSWELGGLLIIFSYLVNPRFANHFYPPFILITVTAASSSTTDIGESFIRLKLETKLTGETDTKETVIELSLPMFYDLLHQLEKTRNTMQQYSQM